jgi:uncharacterized cupin superfamily protein
MNNPMAFRFPATDAQPSTAILDGWRVIDGQPTMKTWVQHTSADGRMISGTWEATPGSYHATYAAYEFVHIMEGEITITPDGGVPIHVGPGDAFVIEANFKGTWKIEKAVRKHFCIPLE